MKKNEVYEINGKYYRILAFDEERVLVIDCIRRTMPFWVNDIELQNGVKVSRERLLDVANVEIFECGQQKTQKLVNERYSLIAGVLPFVTDDKERSWAIRKVAEQYQISQQTIRHYLCLYLAFMDKAVLASKEKTDKELTPDQKNMRWALNKFYYSSDKNSLKTAYTFMLKEKYCDDQGNLREEYPTYNQFRYFFRKTKNYRKYYITREGIKEYQKNHRPLIGGGVQTFAPVIGIGMIDSTICDIYLVNEAGGVVGRPILTACIDAHSGLCCGYSLAWEGGVYSVESMMLNVISDKVAWCSQFGIELEQKDWDCRELPATLVTDMGREYQSIILEQITDLGVKVINLPAYRPELKGSVEKFFDTVQGLYKPSLKGKGVIDPDFQQRGAHDYRLDACLTIRQFETVLLHCIIYYNTKRIMENYPFTGEMIADEVKPYSSSIWNYRKANGAGNLIEVDKDVLVKTLLPRTEGRFTRQGLSVNGMKYHNENYVEKYLEGKAVTVAYDPNNVESVWVIQNGYFDLFRLIETRYAVGSINDALNIKQGQKRAVRGAERESMEGRIDLLSHIETVTNNARQTNADISSIRKNREKEKRKKHRDFASED